MRAERSQKRICRELQSKGMPALPQLRHGIGTPMEAALLEQTAIDWWRGHSNDADHFGIVYYAKQAAATYLSLQGLRPSRRVETAKTASEAILRLTEKLQEQGRM